MLMITMESQTVGLPNGNPRLGNVTSIMKAMGYCSFNGSINLEKPIAALKTIPQTMLLK
jgi:hypothetical protein